MAKFFVLLYISACYLPWLYLSLSIGWLFSWVLKIGLGPPAMKFAWICSSIVIRWEVMHIPVLWWISRLQLLVALSSSNCRLFVKGTFFSWSYEFPSFHFWFDLSFLLILKYSPSGHFVIWFDLYTDAGRYNCFTSPYLGSQL